jgi:hypothetical protein
VYNEKQLDHDLVTHPENLKGEMNTEDYAHYTMWEHELFHMAVWDDQSICDFPALFPTAAQIRDINRIYTEISTSLEAGEIPEWLLVGERDRDEDGVPDMDKLSDSLNRQWIRWQAHNLDIRAAQNLVFMGLGGVVNRMKTPMTEANETIKELFHKKTWVPMSNAGLYQVVTYESATLMGGFTFPGRDANTCFYDARVGLVMPGKRFLETFNLHGTWDQDDAVKVILIKLWASGDYSLHLGRTLPSDAKLPSKKEDAIIMAAFVRSPNGPGEYSIEYIDLDGLFPVEGLLDMDNISYVNMNELPLPQDILLANVKEKAGLKTSITYSGRAITMEDCEYMIKAQLKNPGVGRFCNAMMVWAYTIGGFPTKMVDVMGEIVDACQQGIDMEQFVQITKESDSIWNQFITTVKDRGLKVDKALLATRAPHRVQKALRMYTVEKRFTVVQRHYKETIVKITKELQYKSLQWRLQTKLVNDLRGVTFGPEMAAWSSKFFTKYAIKMSVADSAWTITPEMKQKMDPFTIMHYQYQHKLAMEAVVAGMVKELEAMDDDTRYRSVVGLYKWIVKGDHGKQFPMGRQDRLIFQPAELGHMSVMDILIEGLYYLDLIDIAK